MTDEHVSFHADPIFWRQPTLIILWQQDRAIDPRILADVQKLVPMRATSTKEATSMLGSEAKGSTFDRG